MMIRGFSLSFLLVCWCALAAAETLNVSGIIQGSQPTAIVNDKVVAVGEEIEGYRVVVIGQNSVTFENNQGKKTLYLKEEEKKTNPAAPKPQPALKPAVV